MSLVQNHDSSLQIFRNSRVDPNLQTWDIDDHEIKRQEKNVVGP